MYSGRNYRQFRNAFKGLILLWIVCRYIVKRSFVWFDSWPKWIFAKYLESHQRQMRYFFFFSTSANNNFKNAFICTQNKLTTFENFHSFSQIRFLSHPLLKMLNWISFCRQLDVQNVLQRQFCPISDGLNGGNSKSIFWGTHKLWFQRYWFRNGCWLLLDTWIFLHSSWIPKAFEMYCGFGGSGICWSSPRYILLPGMMVCIWYMFYRYLSNRNTFHM